MNDFVDLVPKTLPKVSGATKYSVYKHNIRVCFLSAC